LTGMPECVTVVPTSQAPGYPFRRPAARDRSELTMARTPFSTREAHVVVSSDGYFDVYPSLRRSPGDRPSYRGVLAELGAGLRGADDRLAIRPGSPVLANAVTAWAAVHGAAAIRGDLGRGRDGQQTES
jgi:hypothetical protein